jgi:iron-sulfur cluster assembly accessory protein
LGFARLGPESQTASIIEITDAAAAKITHIMTQDADGESALRMRVVGGGCSGFQYQLVLEEAPNAEDLVFTSNGITMFIDQKSAVYLTGVQIDYVNGLNESGFKITNPNAQSTCGCGQSFR